MKRTLMLCAVAVLVLAFSTSAFACNMNCDKRGTGQCFDDPTILAGCVQTSPTSCVFEVCHDFVAQSPVLAEHFEVASVTVERPNVDPKTTITQATAVAAVLPAPAIR